MNQPTDKKSKICLRGLSEDELKQFAVSLGQSSYRGKQLAEWLYRKNIAAWAQMKNVPLAFTKMLKEKADLCDIEYVELSQSRDHSTKFLFRTQDGQFIETVIIRKSGRNTVCVSSQLGCKMNCSFCASSKEGFVRSLKASEIISQLALVRSITKEKVDNIVFMGMGEPLDNMDEVIKAIEIMNAEWGYGIGGRKITVSTVGLTEKISQFSDKKLWPVRLSISIHSPWDDLRSTLVPINKKHSLDELMKVLKEEKKKYGREYTFEYTLIHGINDRPKDARKLAALARQVGAKVNLIAYNPIEDASYERSPLVHIRRFRQVLDQEKVRNTLRISAGKDINAACGQLRLKKTKSS